MGRNPGAEYLARCPGYSGGIILKRLTLLLLAVAGLAGILAFTARASGPADDEASPIFGVKIPPGYRDWKLVSVAHEEGKLNDFRAILGNDQRSKRIGKGSFRSRKARSLPESPGVMSRRRKTTKPLDAANLSFPGLPRIRTCSLRSRTQKSTPRRAAGGTLNSIRTAKLPARRRSEPAFPATRRLKLATLSSPVTPLNFRGPGFAVEC